MHVGVDQPGRRGGVVELDDLPVRPDVRVTGFDGADAAGVGEHRRPAGGEPLAVKQSRCPDSQHGWCGTPNATPGQSKFPQIRSDLESAVVDTSSGLTSGTVLEGRYRVGALIARGGMSMVYRGVDLRLDRPVAIKVMSPQYVSDPAFLSRFEREARLAASLGHAGVVAVYDQGRDGDLVFLVMELVDGGTLRDLLREQGSLSVPVTMSIMEPLLAALGAAHAAGLVHRDVKPENVLISAQGAVKIADFGLVRAVSSQTMATGDVILGTVAYLSPEQVATGAADARSDVYAAGVMAYEMLTGHPPYNGDNPMSVAYQHVHSDVPRCSGNAPGTPEALDDLIVAATRRDPDARPRDASAFLAALIGVRSQLGLRRVPVPVPHRRPLAATTAAPQAFAAPVSAGGTRVFAGGPLTVAE